MSVWHLYLIRCRGGTLYTGVATDVDRRFAEHVTGGAKGARYLRGRAPLELVFRTVVGDRTAALRAERAVKRLRRDVKEGLVSGAVSLEGLLPSRLPPERPCGSGNRAHARGRERGPAEV